MCRGGINYPPNGGKQPNKLSFFIPNLIFEDMKTISSDIVVPFVDITNACCNLSNALAVAKETNDLSTFIESVERTLHHLREARKNAVHANDVSAAYIHYLQAQESVGDAK